MNTVAVIDYGMGNLHSVAKALEHVAPKTKVYVTHDPKIIRDAQRVVLPGVGAIRDCMAEIKRLEIDKIVEDILAQGKPFLGVCVGMQALMSYSEENNGVDCLGLIKGHVANFANILNRDSQAEKLKIPHMGWNQVRQRIEHPLWHDIAQDSRFYFVHSYYVVLDDVIYQAATAEYGSEFTAAIAKDNLFAVQFHPEKSQHAGLQLYNNFLNWNG